MSTETCINHNEYLTNYILFGAGPYSGGESPIDASPGPAEGASPVIEPRSDTTLVVHEIVREILPPPTNPRTLTRNQDEFDRQMIRERFREVDVLLENNQTHAVFGPERFIDRARRCWEQLFPADSFHEERFKRHYVVLGIKWLHFRNGIRYVCYDETSGALIDRSPTPGDARRLHFLTLVEKPSHCLRVLEGISQAAEADLGHTLGDKESLLRTIESNLEQAYEQLLYDKVDYYFQIMTRPFKRPIELSTEAECHNEVVAQFENSYDPLLPIGSDVGLVYAIAHRLEQNHRYEYERLDLIELVKYVQEKVEDFNRNLSLEDAMRAAATRVNFQSLS